MHSSPHPGMSVQHAPLPHHPPLLLHSAPTTITTTTGHGKNKYVKYHSVLSNTNPYICQSSSSSSHLVIPVSAQLPRTEKVHIPYYFFSDLTRPRDDVTRRFSCTTAFLPSHNERSIPPRHPLSRYPFLLPVRPGSSALYIVTIMVRRLVQAFVLPN
jgi:hypothetical protein